LSDRGGDKVGLTPQQVIGNAVSYDVILVPALINDIEKSLEANRALIPWLRACHQRGAVLATGCGGGFMLADATSKGAFHERLPAARLAINFESAGTRTSP
jgi:transcriptional regulator GlxA family with amidase domain